MTAELIAQRALVLGTSTLYEASGLPCAANPAIRPVWQGAAIAAPVFPVQCAPGDNLAIHLALERAPKGSVLLVATGSYLAGYWGEVLTVAAEAAGIVGLVTDGGIRDIAAIRRRQFPAFSLGISVCGTVKATAPSVGKPIRFSGVPVAPGDWLIADDDGVVILPANDLDRILSAGEARAAKEATMMEQLAKGLTTVELMGLQGWRDRA